MYKFFLLTLFGILFQQETRSTSPDGKFTFTIIASEETDLQTRYIAKLTDDELKESTEIFNCVRRDLSLPNFYWDKGSKFLVFEQCSDSYKDSSIIILNLKTKKTEFELTGLIGNYDHMQQQFDSDNGILIYFDTSETEVRRIPDLYAFDLKSKIKRKIHEFEGNFDMEFPTIKRIVGMRQISISYYDSVVGKNIIKKIDY